MVRITDVVMGTGGRERERKRGQGRQENVKNSTNVRQEIREKESFNQPTNTHCGESSQNISLNGFGLVRIITKNRTKFILKLSLS